MKRFQWLIVICLTLIITNLGILNYQKPINEYVSMSVIQQTLPSVVYIEVKPEADETYSNYGWSGSGVIVASDGVIVTARHVLENAGEIYVTLADGRKFEALTWYESEIADCGVIIIYARNLPYGLIGNSDCMTTGDRCYIVGSPYGHELFNSVTLGIISGTNRSIFDDYFGSMILQSDAASNPGNSGGGVFNARGELIGILVGGIYGADGVAFIVPSNTVAELLNEIYEKAMRGQE